MFLKLGLTGVELHRCRGLEGWSCRLSVGIGNPNLTVRWLVLLYSPIPASSDGRRRPPPVRVGRLSPKPKPRTKGEHSWADARHVLFLSELQPRAPVFAFCERCGLLVSGIKRS